MPESQTEVFSDGPDELAGQALLVRMQRGRQAALDAGLPSENAELLAEHAAHLKRSPPAGHSPAPALAPSGIPIR
jgi:hypothetical protein